MLSIVADQDATNQPKERKVAMERQSNEDNWFGYLCEALATTKRTASTQIGLKMDVDPNGQNCKAEGGRRWGGTAS